MTRTSSKRHSRSHLEPLNEDAVEFHLEWAILIMSFSCAGLVMVALCLCYLLTRKHPDWRQSLLELAASSIWSSPRRVPSTLEIAGNFQHRRSVQGLYHLVPEHLVHGRAVWRHESADRYVAFMDKLGWAIQSHADLSTSNAHVYQCDRQANDPLDSSTPWVEWNRHTRHWEPVTISVVAAETLAVTRRGELGTQKHNCTCPSPPCVFA
jgi:hypothetical protein